MSMSMSSDFPLRRQTELVSLTKVASPDEAPPGYIAIPSGMLKLAFGLLALLALTTLLAFGLSFIQTRSFDHDLNSRNSEITALETRVTNLGTRIVQLQQELNQIEGHK